MNLQEVLEHYNAGEYTVTDTMLAVLQLVSKDNVHIIVSSLPQEIGVVLREFIEYYHPGVGIFNGPRPSLEVVQFVKGYLSNTSMFLKNQ